MTIKINSLLKNTVLGFLLLTIVLGTLSFLPENVDSSALIGPMCYVVAKIQDIEESTVDVEILSIESKGQRGCPVKEAELYRVSYILLYDQEPNLDVGDQIKAGIESFSSQTPDGIAMVALQWSSTTDQDGSPTNIELNQSSVEPIPLETDELEDEEEAESEETVVDEHTKKSSNLYFDLTLERGPQTPFGNYVPYTLTITPHIDSTRTQILWNMPATLESVPKHEEFVSMQSNQDYVFEGRVKPLREGTYDFSISVISWQHDTNYTNAISDTLVFNGNLVLQPVSSHYQLLNVLRYSGIAILFIAILVGTVIVVKKYTVKAKKWLTPPS